MKENNKLKRSIHFNRRDLVGEHIYGDLLQLVFFIIFMIVWIFDSFFLNYSTFLNKYVFIYIRIPLGFLTLFISGYLAFKGLKIVFVEQREKPILIEEDVFSIVRHPIYLGAILLYLGLFFLTLSILSFVVWIFILILYYFLSVYEEKLLIETFGEEYEIYKKQVPMLVPGKQVKSGKWKK